MRAVCVSVAAVRGSAPREAGAAMLVRAHDCEGSIGGGHLEWHAIATARRLLAQWARCAPSQTPQHRETLSLGPALGQCCGGAVDLLYTASDLLHLPPPAPLFFLQLHGAGHVGRALVRVLATLPCRVQWIDERDDAFPAAPDPDGPARIERLAVDAPQAEVATAPPGAYYLLLTHSHDLDFAIGQAVLERGDFGWLGCIGSATKRARFVRRWQQRGIDAARLARFVCPVGLPGIVGKAPEIIAVSVAAQLLQVTTAQNALALSPVCRHDQPALGSNFERRMHPAQNAPHHGKSLL